MKKTGINKNVIMLCECAVMVALTHSVKAFDISLKIAK